MNGALLAYGTTDEQVVDLAWPDAPGPFRVLVLVHGGFWRQAFGRDLMEPLAEDARARGWATANVEYRRVGGAGGWPATFEDVAAAVDALATADAPLGPPWRGTRPVATSPRGSPRAVACRAMPPARTPGSCRPPSSARPASWPWPGQPGRGLATVPSVT